ncbi:MAG: OmpA family protein [Myxococcota bacterium]|nr:OmpA family protein [Myxococcota bacterium]
MSQTNVWRACAWALLMGGFVLLPAGCRKYKEQIASQKDAIAALENENAELNDSKSDVEAERDALEEEQARLTDRIADLEAQIQSLIDYQKSLENQVEQLGGDKALMAEQHEKAIAAQKMLIAKMRKQQEQARRRLRTLKNMLSKFKSLIAGGKLKVRIRNGKLTLELPSAVLFELGRANLSKDGKETLAEVAGVLSGIRNREFQVAGHTDNVPITSGRFPTNWELSTARAVSVVRFLEEKGVPSRNLSAAGYSKFQPTASNDTKELRALNRRIEITLMPNLDELPDLSDLEKELKR